MAVYLDHNATTPVDPEVLSAMLPFLGRVCGNPSSDHTFGRAAREAIERAREQVAALINAPPGAVVFTSGGTEANNLALQGVAGALPTGEVAVSAIEHVSVLSPAAVLERRGWRLRTVPVDAQGRVTVSALTTALAAMSDATTRLVAIGMANNESGVIQDLAALARRARAHGAVVHTDAVQAAGKVEVDFRASGAHTMSLSAHKIYGPKGVGALVIDKGLDLDPLLLGGGHEGERRAGTENVAGIVGFGAAAERAGRELARRRARLTELRDRLEARLRDIAGVEIFAAQSERLPNTVFFAVPGIDGGTLLVMLDRRGYAVSSGSACSSGSTEPSHVLLAMGVAREHAQCAVRVSLGVDNTAAQIDAFTDCLRREIDGLHGLRAAAMG